MLAKPWKKQDPAGWLVSEKLDGVRASWDGHRLRLRGGRVIHAPAWFTAGLGPEPLDGELWLGRGRFAETVGIVRGSDAGAWAELTYQVFDATDHPGGFADRDAWLAEYAASLPPHVRHVPHVACDGFEHLDRLFADWTAAGAEGVILRDPDAAGESGRSGAMLKRKAVSDLDATVVAHVPGTGQWAGETGSLVCETAAGQRFRVSAGLTAVDRQAPPAVGALVVIRYHELTEAGKPRFPVFAGMRAEQPERERQRRIEARRVERDAHGNTPQMHETEDGELIFCKPRDLDLAKRATRGEASLQVSRPISV